MLEYMLNIANPFQQRYCAVILFTYQQMGSICSYQKANVQTQKKEAKELQQKKITVTHNKERVDFGLSQQSIKNLRGDMLVIFTDASINLKENPYFSKLNSEREKLEKLATQRLKSNPTKYMTLQNSSITTLYYDTISLVVCDIWKDTHSDEKFHQQMKDFVGTFKHHRSVVITQFPSNLGFPLKRSMGFFVSELLKSDDRPSKIYFSCLTSQSLAAIKTVIELTNNGVQKKIEQSENAYY